MMLVLAGVSASLSQALLGVLLDRMGPGRNLHINYPAIVRTLLTTLLLPLACGLGIRRVAPRLARAIAGPAGLLGNLLLLALVGLIVATQHETLAAILPRGWLGMGLLLGANLGTGWCCGGPGGAGRKALAVTTATRNVAVGLAIATGGLAGTPAVTAVVAYGLVSIVGAMGCALLLGRFDAAEPSRISVESQPVEPLPERIEVTVTIAWKPDRLAAASVPAASTGRSSPLGAALVEEGVNFSLYSRSATGVELVFFDREDDASPSRVVRFDRVTNRSYHYWHAFVPGVEPGQLYGYRVAGPAAPESGLRFDPTKVLLDPYGRGVVIPKNYDREAARRPGDNAAAAMKSVVVEPGTYDWEGDMPLGRPSSRTIIYEMHIRGFTQHPSSGVGKTTRGTYAGLVEKIPYLQGLGISAVELLPVFAFDPQACPPGLVNYWGYQPVSFFAPHPAYSSRRDGLGPVDEFRDMVKALHRAGIEVILDVVYNHTAEGGGDGPTLGFRGIDDRTYYILEVGGVRYADYTGCGNTLNGNHPIVRRMIVDSLKYWVEEMHVDGFRFDLASILARDPSGRPLPNPPVLWDIESEPALAGTKLIAEAWDAAELYQVGSFVGDAWKEWNGRFRDDLRDYLRGEGGSVRSLADRLVGSPQIYGHKGREVEQSVNFVTCHDGFTLNDLVSYDEKHNEANGEGNRDGANDNRSWNCGVEGPTDDREIEELRNRQVKNALALTLLSLGMPMILMGDEVRRTQYGNNNDYCHGDESNWFDWTLLEEHADVHRFVSHLNARRLLRDAEHERQRVDLNSFLREAEKTWHGVKLYEPDWGDGSRSIALSAVLCREGLLFHLILNGYWEPLEFELPVHGDGRPWHRWFDTGLNAPHDIASWEESPPVPGGSYRAAARSVVMLFSRSGSGESPTPK
jgi:glycogen operon protein